MAHMVETMAYVGETPWHGLGKRLEKGDDIEEFLVAAGLDWKVEQHPVYSKVGSDMILIPNRFAYHRDTDKSFLTMSRSAEWTPVQNREMMEFFREYIEAGGARLETAGSLRGGREVWALADLNEEWTINRTDRTKGFLLMTTRHEAGTTTQVKTVATRVVCNNTMQVALAETGGIAYRQNHMSPFNMAKAKEHIGLAREEIKKLKMDAQTLSKLRMSEYDNVRLLAEFFQPIEKPTDADVKKLINDPSAQSNKLQAVLHSLKKAPGAIPDNAWGTLNAVTHFFDHIEGQDRARIGKVINGANQNVKDAVRDRLIAMAA